MVKASLPNCIFNISVLKITSSLSCSTTVKPYFHLAEMQHLFRKLFKPVTLKLFLQFRTSMKSFGNLDKYSRRVFSKTLFPLSISNSGPQKNTNSSFLGSFSPSYPLRAYSENCKSSISQSSMKPLAWPFASNQTNNHFLSTILCALNYLASFSNILRTVFCININLYASSSGDLMMAPAFVYYFISLLGTLTKFM